MWTVCVCMWAVCVLHAHRGQKQTLYLLELDLPLAVNHHVLSFVTTTVLSGASRKTVSTGNCRELIHLKGEVSVTPPSLLLTNVFDIWQTYNLTVSPMATTKELGTVGRTGRAWVGLLSSPTQFL